MIAYVTNEIVTHSLTAEGEQIAAKGSHEARVWSAVPAPGGTPVSIRDLKSLVGEESAKIGQGRAFKNGWISKQGENLWKTVRYL